MITLGRTAEDKVTGFKGIVTARSTWLTGCDQYLVCPKAVENKREDSEWFDEGRLKVSGKAITMEETKAPGGPARTKIANSQRG